MNKIYIIAGNNKDMWLKDYEQGGYCSRHMGYPLQVN